MATRIVGVSGGGIDPATKDVSFAFQAQDGSTLSFIASGSSVEQISAALGRMAQDARQRRPQAVASEQVHQYLVQRDAFGGPVLLRLVTPDGVPYTFAIPPAAAADIAARLRTESAKDRKPGRA